MIGITNAINMRTKWNVDDNTLLLITDSIEDKSNYHNTIINQGVTIQSGTLRDGRSSLYFEYPKDCHLEIDTPNSSLRNMMGPNDWTIEFWFYCTYWHTACAAVTVGYITSPSSSGYNSIMFPYGTNAQYIYATTSSSNWNKMNGYCAFPVMTYNQWQHYAVCATEGGTTTKFFRNGILANTLSNNNPAYSNLATVGVTYIGNYAHNYSSSMLLQDIRFSSCARYNANFTPPQRLI